MQFTAPVPLKPLDLSGHGTRPASLTKLSPADLSGILSHPKKGTPAAETNTPEAHHDRLVQQSQKWVAQTFFGTLLKQMRDSPFKSKLFDGGRGGEAFAQMYDQKLVEHMSRGAGKKLVHALVRKLEKTDAAKAYQKQQDAPRALEGVAAGTRQSAGGPTTGDAGRDPQSSPRRPGADAALPKVRIHVAPRPGP